MANGDRYTKQRCEELIEKISQTGARKFDVNRTFDWILLLYLGSDAESIEQIGQVSSSASERVRRFILFALHRAGLIQKKGWLRG